MRLIAASALLLIACGASGQQMEPWGYPDPDAFAKATYTLCAQQNLSVMLAAKHRDQGRTREQVLALVPENPPMLRLRAVDVYRENVEDVFDFPHISTYALMTFRAEVCRREVQSVQRPGRLSGVRASVEACQARHGGAQSNELYGCIRRVVQDMPAP